MNEWDDRAVVEAEFPCDRWDWIPVESEDDATDVVLSMVCRGGGMMTGQARWFGPHDGVVLVRKEDRPASKPMTARVSWWRRLFGIFKKQA